MYRRYIVPLVFVCYNSHCKNKTKKSGGKVTGKKPEIFLRELLEIDTQNPPGKEDMIVRYIIKRMALNVSQYEIFDHG